MLAIFLIIFGIASRFVIHAPNFTPVIAIALFSGVYLNKKYAMFVPVILMIIADLFIGLHNTIFFTWGSMLLVAGLGFWARKNKNVKRIAISGLFSAILFFVITNFGAWLFMYPRTMEGFVNCYIAAIPFFRTTFLSTFVYVFILFGIYEIVANLVKNTRFAKLLLS